MPEEIMYKQFVLDQFQIDAIHSIEHGHSVIVSAATGTGKTLIADYLIDKFLKEGKRVVYTAPIKALSNQKYKDFKKEYGEHNVGIMTGDVVINPGAPVIIMTTEIFRNMLITKDNAIENISYVVFDEIHYINDIERGTVWEESIIFAPEHIRFLCLSATIPNAEEFADWIRTLRKQQVDVVSYEKRAVPLKHFVYDRIYGLTTAEELKKRIDTPEFGDYHAATRKRKGHFEDNVRAPSHISLVEELTDRQWLPCIFFVFNRARTQELAEELSRRQNYLSKEEKQRMMKVINEKLAGQDNIRALRSTQLLRMVLMNGIAFHHAGLLPVQKEIVEDVFALGLIRVLYATETFSVGVNYPAKSVCFFSLEKYDGITFRPLNTKEYFQLAGRAGRRGIDTEGFAVALYNRRSVDIEDVIVLSKKDIVPIRSQFKLSYNSVLNLKRYHKEEQIEKILKSNFDYFLRKKKNENIKIMASYNNKVKILTKLGYIGTDNTLTAKGIFATHIYSHELVVSEIFATDLWKQMNELDLTILVAAIMYEPRRMEQFSTRGHHDRLNKIWNALMTNRNLKEQLQRHHDKENVFGRTAILKMVKIVSVWADGGEFVELLRLTNLLEGDVVRLFRQTVDMLEQVKRASMDQELIEKIERCREAIYRDIIKPEF